MNLFRKFVYFLSLLSEKRIPILITIGNSGGTARVRAVMIFMIMFHGEWYVNKGWYVDTSVQVHTQKNVSSKICVSCWNLNLLGEGYRMDLTSSPLADMKPVRTASIKTPSSPPYRFCTTWVPENKKCLL